MRRQARLVHANEAGEGIALLPWESADDYRALLDAFEREHAPSGATEQALVARLVWIEWRRRRLALAERAAHMAALADRVDGSARMLTHAGVRERTVQGRLDIADVVASKPADDAVESLRHDADRKATERALVILDKGGAEAYARALAALHEDTRAWWEDGLAGEYGEEWRWTAEADSLAAFLREEVGPADEAVACADSARPVVRLQAFGESLDPDRIDRLLAIDARLDRQFEKALSMLIQLQQMRRTPRARRNTPALTPPRG